MTAWASSDPERGTIEPDRADRPWDGPAPWSSAAMRGLLVIMVPIASMFGVVISAYLMRRFGADWEPVPMPWQLWLSTALLIASSVAFEIARRGCKRNEVAALRGGLLAAGVLALGFLAVQLWAWQHMRGLGYFLAGNPANSFFYMMTGLHGVHLIAGLIAWIRSRAVLARSGAPRDVQVIVSLCAVYWHFLLAVWIVLFGVMLLKS